jgi:hypothetical protein
MQLKTMIFCITTAFACALALVSIGCGPREHIRPDHGQKTKAFLAKQHVYTQAAPDRPQGLDSEESSIIYANYKANMKSGCKSGAEESKSRVLIVDEGKKDKGN